MRKNFDMDAAIRRALRESIEAHAHEWEPNPDAKSSEIGDGSPFEKKVSAGEMDEGTIPGDSHEWEPDFKTGVGPVGDDAPFDNKVSESCDKEEGCCPKCGKCPCECEKQEGDMNEGTIPGDSHEWEPDFKTGVGEVGDDNPFTQAVNESLTDTRDWEDDSFGASEPKKEGIAYADGAEECDNGVVATSQKNSGEVVSKDNISESAGEEQKNEDDVIKEERDRFFNILNRIEKLYD